MGFAVAASLAAHAPFIALASGTSLPHDWPQFNALSLAVRSNVLSYGRFPLHNPWICGGMDVLANPQNRVFSPLFLADLALPPQWANLFGLIAYGAIGFIGVFLLLARLGISRGTALVGAALFINSGWFGLHFAAGHIAYGSMQLLPLVMYLGLRCDSRKHVVLLGLLMALFLLDGAIYTFIYASLVLLTAVAAGLIPRFRLRVALLDRPLHSSAVAIAALLLALPKILPVVYAIGDRTPVLDGVTMPPALLVRALLMPFHVIDEAPGDGLPFLMHEYGTYLSLPGLLLLVLIGAGQPRGYWKRAWPFLAVALFWLWVASGLLPRINPWRLFQEIPLVNNAHVQSRLILILYLFFVILVALALDHLRGRSVRLFALMGGLLVIESLAVRGYPVLAGTRLDEPAPTALVQHQTISTTRERGWTPQHYYDGAGSATCYEEAFKPRLVRYQGQPDYRGEAYLIDPAAGQVRLTRYTPGWIELVHEFQRPAVIELNTNALYGWRADPPQAAQVSGHHTDLLRVQPAALSGTIRLRYWPPYMFGIMGAFAAGLTLFGWLWSTSGRRPADRRRVLLDEASNSSDQAWGESHNAHARTGHFRPH